MYDKMQENVIKVNMLGGFSIWKPGMAEPLRVFSRDISINNIAFTPIKTAVTDQNLWLPSLFST